LHFAASVPVHLYSLYLSSDKKPGEIVTWQLIVDLLMILFEVYPPSSLPSVGSVPPRREVYETSPRHTITLPYPHQTLYSLLRSLLLTPAPQATDGPEVPLSPHEFHRCPAPSVYLQVVSAGAIRHLLRLFLDLMSSEQHRLAPLQS
jgi:hypothetical protein